MGVPGMAEVVMRSIEDASGQRCVDLIRGAGGWAYVECRRDPEDAHGWRRLGEPVSGFASQEAALDAARAAVPWLAEEGAGSPRVDGCAFCRIAADTAQVVMLHDDADLIVFLDHMPIRPGHCMIMPRRHYPYFDDIPVELAARAFTLAQRIARAMKRTYAVERVAFFATGTDVAHAHLHLVPMYEKTDLTSARYMANEPVFRGIDTAPRGTLAAEADRLRAALEETR